MDGLTDARVVAVLLANAHGGGAERALIHVAGAMARRGRDVDLVLQRAVGPLMPEVDPAVNVVELRRSRLLTAWPALVSYLRRRRPEALLSGLAHLNVAAVLAVRAAATGTAVVLSAQNMIGPRVGVGRGLLGRGFGALVRRTYARADEIAAVSGGVADDVSATTGVSRAAIRVVPNPVPDAIHELAAEPLGTDWFDGPGPVAIAVGRLDPQKDHETLLRAIVLARREVDVRLVILGEGRLRPHLERLTADLGLHGAVSMPGFMANPYPAMRRADLFVLSSRFEGLANVVVEALALGTRIVATDCPSGPSEILHAGRYGALVPVGDPAALAQVMVAELRDRPTRPRPDLARYHLDAVTSSMLEVIDAAFAQRRVGGPPRRRAH